MIQKFQKEGCLIKHQPNWRCHLKFQILSTLFSNVKYSPKIKILFVNKVYWCTVCFLVSQTPYATFVFVIQRLLGSKIAIDI